jgi:hypothetical protein
MNHSSCRIEKAIRTEETCASLVGMASTGIYMGRGGVVDVKWKEPTAELDLDNHARSANQIYQLRRLLITVIYYYQSKRGFPGD